jgi:EmrB/QacA subfamily drug resistance transporter
MFALAATVVGPLYAKFSYVYGRRAAFVVSICLFITGSVACALSPNMLVLILARACQGLGGGGLVLLGQTIIGLIFPPKTRTRYEAFISVMYAIAGVAGPLLGGSIAEHLHWSFIFWINPPIGLLALWLIYSILRKVPAREHHHRLDAAGVVLLVVGTLALLLALNWGGVRYAWDSAQVLGLFAVFAAFMCLFLWRERRAAEPLLPFSVMSNRVILTATLSCTLAVGAGLGLTIFTPIYFESVHHLTPTLSGAALIPFMLGLSIGAAISGTAAGKVTPYKRLPIAGLAVAGAATMLLAADPGGLPFALTEALLSLTAIGYAMIVPVALICVQNAAPVGKLGTATAVLVFMRQLGGAATIAVFGAILFSQLNASGDLPVIAGIDFTKSNADFATIYAWIFGAAALGFLAALTALLKMAELPLRE